VPGYSSVQVSLHFSQDCLPLDPDLVTLCVGVNDAFTIPNLCNDDKNLYVPWRRFIRKARKTLGHSRLFTLLDSGVIWLINRRPTSVNDARSSQGMKPRVDLQSYYDNLLSIAQTCRRRGIPLLLFSFSLPDDYSRAMQRAAQNSKAYYIDLEPAFEHAAKTLANNPTTDAQPDVAFERPHAAAVGRLFAGVY